MPALPYLTLVVAAGLSGFAALLWVFARCPTAAVAALLGVGVWGSAANGTPAVNFGVQIYPGDVLTACALCVGASRVVTSRRASRSGLRLLVALIALTAWSTLRGIADFGLETAGNGGRSYFWSVLAAALYVATLPTKAAIGRVVVRLWVASAAGYAVVCLFGWAKYGIHSVAESISANGELIDTRPIHAASNLVLIQAAALLLLPLGDAQKPGRLRRMKPGGIFGAAVLMVFVIILQHRTNWAVAAVMLVVAWARLPARRGQRVVSALACSVGLAAIALAFAAGIFGGLGGTLANSLDETQDRHSTFRWRVVGWRELLQKPRSLSDWAIGSPFGTGYERHLDGWLVTACPHNYYLEVLLCLGLFGLALLVALYTGAWRSLARVGWGTFGLRLVLVGQLVFSLTNPLFAEQGVLLGLCIWCVRTADMPAAANPGVGVRATTGRLDSRQPASPRRVCRIPRGHRPTQQASTPRDLVKR